MSQKLQPPQSYLPQQVTDMQRVGCWVKTYINTKRRLSRARGDRCTVCAVVNQATGAKLFDEVLRRCHDAILGVRTS